MANRRSKLPTLNLIMLNLFLALLWPALNQQFGTVDLAIGFLIGFGLLSVVEWEYRRRMLRPIGFVLYVGWSILVSNVTLAWLIVQPKPRLDPGIIAVPLTADTDLELIVLATVITLTPGTISVDLGTNPQGERVLYVHSLKVGDPDAFRTSIQQGFERRLLQITRGTP